MDSARDDPKGPGFPIRKSTDQSLFAAPRGLSQRTTSFIASCRQGIHQMPLRHLIVLIINARPDVRPRPRQSMCVGGRAVTDIDQLVLRSICLPIESLATDKPVTKACRSGRQIPSFTMSKNADGSATRSAKPVCSQPVAGGARRDRTDDLLLAKQALSQLSYGPVQKSETRSRKPENGLCPDGKDRRPAPFWFLASGFWLLNMVGLGRLELPTSRLSGVRSNHLSYRPGTHMGEHALAPLHH